MLLTYKKLTYASCVVYILANKQHKNEMIQMLILSTFDVNFNNKKYEIGHRISFLSGKSFPN